MFHLSLQESLGVLNINKNNIDDVRDLAILKKLTHFFAADNQLQDMQVRAPTFPHESTATDGVS